MKGAPLSAGIRARLAFLLFIASLPALALVIADAAYRYGQERTNALQELRQLADALGETEGALLRDVRAFLQNLASASEVSGLRDDPLACEQTIATALKGNPQYAFLAAVDFAGRVVCPGLPLQEALDVRHAAWFQRVLVQKDFIVGNYTMDPANKAPAVSLAYPIFAASGEMIGAAYAALHADWLKQQLVGLALPEGYASGLVESSGELVAAHPETENPFGHELPLSAMTQAFAPTRTVALAGTNWLIASAPLGGIPWKGLVVLVAVDEARLWRVVWRHVALGVALYLAVLALGVVAAVFGAYRLVVLPVRGLHQATEQLSAGGHNFAAAPRDEDRSELADLARAFRRMASTLEAQQSALRSASAQKSRFLAVASHDLRQPLHAAMMSLEFASRGASPDVLAYIERARRSIRRLAQQLDMLAGIVERDALGTDLGPRVWQVPVAKVLRRVAEAYSPLAREKGLGFHVVMSRLVVATDEAFLATILDNLVDNAIKYTERGRIVVGCRRRAGICRLEVHDTGRGIPAERLEHIFDAFYRLDQSAGEGLGLGLLIVKETATMLRHRLAVRSTPGVGSCFTVEIPLWSAWGASPPAAPAEVAR